MVLFFLNMLVRCNTLPDCDKQLHAAIKIAESARDELPNTRIIGNGIPDALGKALTAAFGSQLRKLTWEQHSAPDTDSIDEPQAKKPRRDDSPETTTQPMDEVMSKMEIDDDGASIGAISSTAPLSNECSATIVDVGAEDPPSEDVVMKESAQDWNSNLEAGWGVVSEGWGDTIADDTWAEEEAWKIPSSSLMTLLGPTTIPLTHEVGYVEESTRYVSKVIMPPEKKDKDVSCCSDPFTVFAQVILKPYKEFAPDHWGTIQRPQLVNDPLEQLEGASVGAGELSGPTSRFSRHDPEKDGITILVDPNLAPSFLRGMGVGGTFVQLVPEKPTRTTSKRGRGRGRGGASSAANSRETDGTFWYPEKLTQVITSFWTEKSKGYGQTKPSVTLS